MLVPVTYLNQPAIAPGAAVVVENSRVVGEILFVPLVKDFAVVTRSAVLPDEHSALGQFLGAFEEQNEAGLAELKG